MTRMNTKLTVAVETYLADLRRVSASGGATGERSSYGPLANLLNAVGATLKPKVFCVGELADQGAGHPDFGLYAAKQVQKGQPHEGQIPECGVVEVKSVRRRCVAHGRRRSGEPLLEPLPPGAGDQHTRLRAGGRGCGRPTGQARNLPVSRRRGGFPPASGASPYVRSGNRCGSG